jgi:hypothetical protein
MPGAARRGRRPLKVSHACAARSLQALPPGARSKPAHNGAGARSVGRSGRTLHDVLSDAGWFTSQPTPSLYPVPARRRLGKRASGRLRCRRDPPSKAREHLTFLRFATVGHLRKLRARPRPDLEPCLEVIAHSLQHWVRISQSPRQRSAC